MSDNPYARFKDSDLILRDELAIDRTVLANERTLLAYVRTGLAFCLTGAGAIKFVTSPGGLVVGWCLVGVSLAVVVLGVSRYRRVARHVAAARQAPVGPPGQETSPR
jgi:putative membrane protein